jgi:hypothetical protein
VFATMRRKRRSTKMKNEIGLSVDHFKRAASLAAQETGATVGPKFNAARDRVQPAAVKAKETASSSWDNALAALTPLVTAATQSATTSKKALKANKKDAKKNAKKIEKRTDKALGRKQGSKTSTLAGLALVGAAVGVAAAYVVRRRKAAQWDEYDPSAPISSTQPVIGADDAVFEPTDSTTGYSAPTTKD